MKTTLILMATMLLSPLALADVVIIGHPSGPDSVSENDVRDIYLNRSNSLTPFELPEGNATRAEFHEKITGRNDAQLKAFWSQQIFTGRGNPPKEQGSGDAMKGAVASTPGSIGYIDSANVDDSVKVLLTP